MAGSSSALLSISSSKQKERNTIGTRPRGTRFPLVVCTNRRDGEPTLVLVHKQRRDVGRIGLVKAASTHMWSSPVPSMSFRLPATGPILALTRPFKAMSAFFLPREGDCYSGGTPPGKSTMAGILPEAQRTQMEADLCAVLLCRACSRIPDRCFVLQQIADAKTSSRARGGDVWVSGCRPLRRTKYLHHPTPLASERACVCSLVHPRSRG
ncbi:hypothetical protein LX32DRAFT_222873 [Colletotrichum zoysiae]|uniref:Uncharacterized protein n=1 Tax=Colletotrichum zoysiae TaxID=1216348 RepID=A0AAD9H517_9PEZI|nr:hypothetical protein LX32DRAFT_222873 [Colletotrichum zoysiae]